MGNNRLIVKNISSKTDGRDLKELMRKAGNVLFCDAHQEKRNEGFVEFKDKRDVEIAIRMFDDTDLKGSRIKLDKYRISRSRSQSRGRSWSYGKGNKRRKSSHKDRSNRSASKSKTLIKES